MFGKQPQASPDSPCVRNCCLDADDICMGCGRQLEDILQWHRLSTNERANILQRAASRRSKLPDTAKRT